MRVMTYKEALKLKKGDKVVQKANGYVIIVESIEEYTNWRNSNKYVMIKGITESGSIMKHNHKEVNKYMEQCV